MWKKVLGALAVLVVAFVAVVSMQSAEFAVTRTGHVSAPPDVVFGVLDDFKVWSSWSPWSDLDPDQKVTFGDVTSGVGATYAWEGNDKVGSGTMAISAAEAPTRVAMKLHFEKPFAADNDVTFDIVPDGEGSKVTWTMSGTKNFGAKVAGLFMDMDKMVGGDFEKGLVRLDGFAAAEAKRLADEKAAAEAQAAAQAAPAPVDGAAAPTDAPTPQ